MDIRKLQRAIVDGLEDVKAQNIVVFNTEHLSPLFERVIIASGTSNRQTKALAASVRDAVKSRGFGPTAHRGRGKRRVDHRRLRRRRGAPDAAGHPRVLPPRGDLGRQAGAAQARRRRRRGSSRRPSPSPRRREGAGGEEGRREGGSADERRREEAAARVARQPAANAAPVKKAAAKAAAAKKPRPPARRRRHRRARCP